MNEQLVTYTDLFSAALKAAEKVSSYLEGKKVQWPWRIYPIPRGGVPASFLLLPLLRRQAILVDDPKAADICFDDLLDSGKTAARMEADYALPTFALFHKKEEHSARAGTYRPIGHWLVFPWEGGAHASVEDAVVRLLQYIGEDADRQGLLETPKRVAKAWKTWSSGYAMSPSEVLKTFSDGAEVYDEMVVVKSIPFYSTCEHHMAPFFGTATIAYIPNGRIVGLSKLSRLVDVFSRRLQVQERLTSQIADALVEHLNPRGVGVTMKARHLCMESRGICKQGHHTITNAVRGALKDLPEARAEFMQLGA